MAMRARDFADRLREVKSGVQAGIDDPELHDSLLRVSELFKRTCSPEAFKQMLADDREVDSGLEEEMTTLWMRFVRRRGVG
jgi:hypothetical protein